RSWLLRFVRFDRDRRSHRRLGEVIEASRARGLPPESDPGAHEGGLDLTHTLEGEQLESAVVGRTRARERLPQPAGLGLVAGCLGRVARKLRVSRLRERRDSNEIGIDEKSLAA